MSYAGYSLQDLKALFAHLRQAPVGGGRAPHKPLLILWMLGRYQHANFGDATFAEVREPLVALLRDFGPPSAGAPDVVNPFWRLQNDHDGKIWRVRSTTGERVAEDVHPPTIRVLTESNARGNFAPPVREAFEANPIYIEAIAGGLLAAHFPQSLHDDVCSQIGLDLADGVPEPPADPDNPRDPLFRVRVIRAYEYRCAITGWNLRIENSLAGLEAAHIKWHVAGGPCTERNGLPLNALHHKLFDLGAFTLTLDDYPVVQVSQLAHGDQAVNELLLKYHGQRIRVPQDRRWLPAPEFVDWHRTEVFKGPPRS